MGGMIENTWAFNLFDFSFWPVHVDRRIAYTTEISCQWKLSMLEYQSYADKKIVLLFCKATKLCDVRFPWRWTPSWLIYYWCRACRLSPRLRTVYGRRYWGNERFSTTVEITGQLLEPKTVMWGHVRSCDAMWCHVMPCELMGGHVMSCDHHVMPCELMGSCDVMWPAYDVMWCHTKSCNVMWGHVMSCDS